MLLSERIISAQKDDEIVRLKQQYQHMLEQFRFGQSSESGPNQTALFNEAEQALGEPVDNSPEKAVAGHARQKPKRLLRVLGWLSLRTPFFLWVSLGLIGLTPSIFWCCWASQPSRSQDRRSVVSSDRVPSNLKGSICALIRININY
jgi:hypothetical protein